MLGGQPVADQLRSALADARHHLQQPLVDRGHQNHDGVGVSQPVDARRHQRQRRHLTGAGHDLGAHFSGEPQPRLPSTGLVVEARVLDSDTGGHRQPEKQLLDVAA